MHITGGCILFLFHFLPVFAQPVNYVLYEVKWLWEFISTESWCFNLNLVAETLYTILMIRKFKVIIANSEHNLV